MCQECSPVGHKQSRAVKQEWKNDDTIYLQSRKNMQHSKSLIKSIVFLILPSQIKVELIWK